MVLILASFCLIHNMSRFLWHGWDFGYPVTLIPWFSIANSSLKANNLKQILTFIEILKVFIQPKMDVAVCLSHIPDFFQAYERACYHWTPFL